MRIAIIDDGRSCARKASNYISQVSWDPRGRKAFSNEWFLLERLIGRYVQLLLITVDAFVALCRQVTCLIPTLPRLPVMPATISPDRYSMSDFERRSQQMPRAPFFHRNAVPLTALARPEQRSRVRSRSVYAAMAGVLLREFCRCSHSEALLNPKEELKGFRMTLTLMQEC